MVVLMKDRTHFLRLIKTDFSSDKLGKTFEYLSYLFIILAIISIPLFTYREQYNTITNILCAVASAFAVIYVFLRGKFVFNFSMICLILFLLYAGVITLFTTREVGFERLTSIFTLYSFIFCLTQFWMNTKKVNIFIYSVCISLLIFLAFFVYTYRDNIIHLNFDERFGYDYGNVNSICFMLAMGVIFLLYVSLTKRRYWYLLIFPALIMFFCALITGSRWGFVSLLFGILALTYQLFGRKHNALYFLSIFIIIGIAYGVIQLPMFASYKHHFEDLFSFLGNSSKRGSSAVRTAMFIDGVKLWSKNLFLGYGCEGFKANTSYGMYSHSSSIELLTNFGLFGSFFFYFPFFKILFTGQKNKYEYFYLTKTIGFTFIFYSLFAVLHVLKFGMICWGFFLGCDFNANKDRQNYFTLSFFENKKFKFNFSFVEAKQNQVSNFNPTKFKIAFVISSLYGGGAERVASILANQWVSKGCDVAFFLTSKSTRESYFIDKRIKVFRLPLKSKFDKLPMVKSDRLTDLIDSYSADIIVSFLSMPSYYASCAAKNLGIPFVCSERCDPSKVNSVFLKVLRTMTLHRAKYIVFQGKNAKEYFSKTIQKKSSIIINPVSVNPSTSKQICKTIVSAGRLEDLKGFDILIKSFEKVHKEFPDYNLKIYGEGSKKDKLIELTKSLKLDKSVNILPFTKDLHNRISECSLYVLSSRYEGMPNILFEACLLGIPSVATDCPVGAHIDLLKNNCLICQHNSEYELTRSICYALKNLDTLRVNAKENLGYYQNLLDPEKIGDEWLDIFKRVLEVHALYE